MLVKDPAWNDNFREKEEGLKDGARERLRDGDRVRQGEKEQEDAITRAEDPRKVEDEEGREDLGGKQPESEEDPKGDTDKARSNEEEEKEEERRGSRGSFGVGSQPERRTLPKNHARFLEERGCTRYRDFLPQMYLLGLRDTRGK
ncbi:hypothetical protein NDU88_006068 [Pleurodeles waltl]|uniref:Uncharacterized protein n=1 Tax=Pleurodeles waltl TaxID=8319 RepID=A0AAV7MIR8_PLEWA|nr:hypothetical protein NDU88_006068 [Pleurodeles waltl]